MFSVVTILVVLALLLAVFSFFASQCPLLGVSVILLAVAMLVNAHPLIK